MPLEHSGTRAAISNNIREMIASGHPKRVAIAAALHTADRYGRAAGGSTPTVPLYQTGASAVNSSGYVPTSQSGGITGVGQSNNFGLDPNTGALTPDTTNMLQSFAMRGLPGWQPYAGNGAGVSPNASAASTAPLVPGQSMTPQGLYTPANGPQPAGYAPIGGTVTGDWGGSGGGGGNKRGGEIGRAMGGIPPMSEMAPWFTRSEAHMADHPSGLVGTLGAGRTDNVPLSVAAGSHVIPSDVVAGVGQGNTLAGGHALSMAMKSGPGGISLPSGPHRSTIPAPPKIGKFAKGGEPTWNGEPIKMVKGSAKDGVKCIVAGGEFIFGPEHVEKVRYKGKSGHDAIDSWIVDQRKKHVKTLKSLPGPVKE